MWVFDGHKPLSCEFLRLLWLILSNSLENKRSKGVLNDFRANSERLIANMEALIETIIFFKKQAKSKPLGVR